MKQECSFNLKIELKHTSNLTKFDQIMITLTPVF
jgi:hypothetical protein